MGKTDTQTRRLLLREQNNKHANKLQLTSGSEGNAEGTAGQGAHGDDGTGNDQHGADGGVGTHGEALNDHVGRAEHAGVGDALGGAVGACRWIEDSKVWQENE